MRLHIIFKKYLQFIFNIIFIYNICIGKIAGIGNRRFSRTLNVDHLCNISLTGGDTACHLYAGSCLFQTSLLNTVSITYFHRASKNAGKPTITCARRASLIPLCLFRLI